VASSSKNKFPLKKNSASIKPQTLKVSPKAQKKPLSVKSTPQATLKIKPQALQTLATKTPLAKKTKALPSKQPAQINKAAGAKGTSKPSSSFVFQEPSFSYPMHYGYDQVTLLVRDPHSIFAYWSFTEETLHHFKKRYEDETNFEKIKLTLRVFNGFDGFSSNATLLQEIFPLFNSVNCYIQAVPNQKYFCDMGFLTEEGDFIHLTRSNLVETPTDRFSQNSDVSWMTESKITGSRIVGNNFNQAAGAHRVFDNKITKQKDEYKTAGAKQHKNLSSAAFSSAALSSGALSSGSLSSSALSSFSLSSHALSSGALSSGALSSGALSSGSLSSSAFSSFSLSSHALFSGALSSWEGISLFSSKNPQALFSYALSSGALSSHSFSSSSMKNPQALPRNAMDPCSEHFYGRTDPQATLYVDGVVKKVNPDGTFSVPLSIPKEQGIISTIRVVLPNGEELSFKR